MPVELRCLSDGTVMCILLFFSKGGGSMSVLWSSSEIPWFLLNNSASCIAKGKKKKNEGTIKHK